MNSPVALVSESAFLVARLSDMLAMVDWCSVYRFVLQCRQYCNEGGKVWSANIFKYDFLALVIRHVLKLFSYFIVNIA